MHGRAGVLWAWGIVLLCLGLILLAAWAALRDTGGRRMTVTIGATAVTARIARTDAERERGLSGVDTLGSGDGMLLVFDRDGLQPIWMKDMKVPLDIIWLNMQKKVVHIEHDVSPDTYPTTYRSRVPARYVLEVPAGTAAHARIVTGTLAAFDLP